MQNPRMPALLVLLLAAAAPAVAAEAARENPLGQVLSLLESLSAKIMKEGEAELKAFKEFQAWCADATRNKGFEIKTLTAKKEKLEATIGKSTGDVEASSTEIEELAASITTDEADLKSATVVREKESADFKANEAELTDVVDTLGRAITVIEHQMAKNPAAFAQMDASSLDGLLKSLGALVDAAAFSSADKQKLLSMVQAQQGAGGEDDDFGAPAAAAYKTHSTNILDVLEDLKEKAEEQLGELRKAETNARHNYEMLKQSLEDQLAADGKNMKEAKMAKASAAETKASAEGDLSATLRELADAKSALELAQGNCMETATNHEASTKARQEELGVIAKAIDTLRNSTGGAVEQTYSLLQLEGGRAHSAESQLQTSEDLAKAEVLTLVKRLAHEHHSAALAQLASHIAAVLRFGAGAGEDPFKKVKDLISDLISRLEAEAHSESTEKAYCDEQLAKTEEKKDELTYDISKLTAKIDQSVAKSAGLKSDVRQLQSELAALAKEQAEMDAIRRESNAAYVVAKADLEAGLAGVRKALGVLRQYYAEGAAALVQDSAGDDASMQQPAVPGVHSKATGAGSSIIGLLEVVESDFAKNLATEEAEEDQAEVEYQKTTQTNKVTRTLKEQDVKYNTQEFKQLDRNIADLTSDRETTDAELNAVLEYYAKIKERCIAKPETYEERKARRTAEIQGLKEALSILEDEAVFAQRRKRGSRGHFMGVQRH